MTRVFPVLLLLAIGCPKATTAPESTSIATSVSAGPGTSAMHERLTGLTTARDALVEGRTAQSRDLLRSMADLESEAMAPEDWRQHLQDLVEATAEGSEGADDAAIAGSVAEAARACGACHAAAGSGPTFEPVPLPAEDDVMGRHVWASDRMWESVIASDADAWRAAREALGEEDDRPMNLFDDVALDVRGQAAQLRSRLHGLVATGAEAGSPDERAAIYGAVLATCTDCHRLAAADD